jgi:zinc protease
MTVGMANVERAEIAGIPAFLAEVGGQARAGLVFGVGAADEPLAIRGITHLCEHLVLSDIPRGDHSFNGTVGWNSTAFVTAGAPTDVASFLTELFPRLACVPVERLEKERSTLRAESDGRATTVLDLLLQGRFGARSYGRVLFAEFGLSHLTADDLQSWAAEHLVASRAALWIAAPDPHSLLAAVDADIEVGTPIEPRSLDAVTPLPGHFTAQVGGPALSLVTRHSVPMTAAVTLLRDRLEDDVRHEHALVYTVAASLDGLGHGFTHSYLGADSPAASRDEASQKMLAAVESFAETTVAEALVDRYRTRVRAAWDSPDYAGGLAADGAHGHVAGVDRSFDDFRRDIDALTSESIKATFAEALDSALCVLPEGARPPRRFPATATPAGEPIEGTSFRPVVGVDTQLSLQVGASAVSFSDATSRRLTVSADQCEAILWWEDGQRAIAASDGRWLRFVPWAWRNGEQATAWIDAAMPVTRRVPMGEGGGPPAAYRPGWRPSLGRWVTAHRWAAAGLLLLAVTPLLVASLVFRSNEGEEERREQQRDEFIDSANRFLAERLEMQAEQQIARTGAQLFGTEPDVFVSVACAPPEAPTAGTVFPCVAQGATGSQYEFTVEVADDGDIDVTATKGVAVLGEEP